MKSKSFFDPHLYKEGLRSQQAIGIIFTALLSVFSFIIPLAIFSNEDMYTNYKLLTQLNDVNILFTILYFFIIVLVVPVLTLRSFSFLTTRNGSDFYHSIPHKKQCVFISFAASAFTWIMAATVFPCIIIYTILSVSGVTVLSLFMLVSIMLHILVAALLVMSVICIACAITGTMLTNILATGLLLFFPRLFIFACRIILCYITGRLIPSNGFFFGTRGNLVVQSILGFTNPTNYLYNIAPLIYTLLLAILYLTIAFFLFKKRHSELAMKPALSSRLQAFLCLLLGTALSVFPIFYISLAIHENDYSSLEDGFFPLLIIYLFIIIAMGVYELLTTKTVRNLKKIIPRTGILVLINILMLSGLFLGKTILSSYAPDASDIKSVSFSFNNYDKDTLFDIYNYNSSLLSWDNQYSNGDKDYFKQKATMYKTSNKEVIELIASAYKRINNKEVISEERPLSVTINTGLCSRTRILPLSYKEYAKILNLITKENDFLSIFTDLPELNRSQLSLSTEDNANLSKDELLKLYNSARNEIKEQPNYLFNDSYMERSIASIQFIQLDINGYSIGTIPIKPSLPETYKLYISLTNAKNPLSISKFLEKCNSFSSSDYYSAIINLAAYNQGNSYVTDYDTSIYMDEFSSDKTVKEILSLLLKNESTSIDFTDKDSYLLNVTMSYYDYQKDKSYTYTRYLQVEKAAFSKLMNQYQSSKYGYEDYDS